MKNKAIFQILSLCFIAALVLVIVSCSDSSEKSTGNDNSNVTTAAESTAEETVAPTILDTLPKDDFGGDTITILARSDSWWQITRISATEINGEIINDAIYNRNLDFEAKYNANLDIQEIPDSLVSPVRNVVLAGEDLYDLVLPNLSDSAVLAGEDILFDLNQVDTIDFTNPAWDQNAVKFYSLAHKLYFGVSDISLGKNECAWIYMFNKRLMEDYSLGDPYQLVRDKQWTFDKSLEMMQAASADLNGNGVADYNDDRFGLQTHDVNYYALLISAGQVLAEKDGDDLPYMNVKTEKFVDVFNKIKDNFVNTTQTVMEQGSEPFLTGPFVSGRALLCGQVLACVRLARGMEDDFGIIPTPMYNENQESYYTYVIPYDVFAVSIPVTAADSERSGMAAQAMAILSDYYVTPAYYDVTITGKALRDENSEEMLDIILNSAVYDMARMYNWGSFASGLANDIKGQKDFASGFARKEESIDKAIQKTIDNFLANAN